MEAALEDPAITQNKEASTAPKIDTQINNDNLLKRAVRSKWGRRIATFTTVGLLGGIASSCKEAVAPTMEDANALRSPSATVQAGERPADEIEPIFQGERADFFNTLKEYINLKDNKNLYRSVIQALDPKNPDSTQHFQAVNPHELNVDKNIYTLTLPKGESIPGIRASYAKFVITKINGEVAQIVFYVEKEKPETPGILHFTKKELEAIAKQTYTNQPAMGYGYIAEDTKRAENSYTRVKVPEDQNKRGINGKVFSKGQLVSEMEAEPDGRFITRFFQPKSPTIPQ